MSAATWAEVKAKAAEVRAATAIVEEPTKPAIEEVLSPVMTPAEEQPPIPVQPKSERSGGGGGGPEMRLARGQHEEAFGICPEGSKPKFVKITSGVHCQTRGPILLVKFPAKERGEARPWLIYQLPDGKRLSFYERRDEILEWVACSELLGYPSSSIGDAKGQARALIWNADGRLGT